MRRDEIRVRVFIEGVLVPKISSVNVQGFNNEASMASITMPPVAKIATEELTRARVHIFWSDRRIRRLSADNQWPILFEGEIVADSYSKTPQSRHISFRCQGYNTYWEQVYIYFYDLSHSTGGIQDILSKNMSLFLGNKRLELDVNVAGVDLISRLAEIVDEHLASPYASIVREIFEDSLDVNFYFREANNALRLSNRFVSVQDDFADLIKTKDLFKRYVTNDISSISGQASMMSILKSVLSVFRYQIICNPQPAYLDDILAEKKTEEKITEDTETVGNTITQYISSVTGLLNEDVDDISITGQTTNGDIGDIIKELERRVEKESDSTVDTNRDSPGLSDFADSPPPRRQTSALNFTEQGKLLTRFELQGQRDRLKRLDDTTSNPEKAERVPSIRGTTDLLAQYLIVPDTRFALPPTCNTIFPQDQSSFGMDRELLREPTRAISTVDPETGSYRMYMAPPNINEAAIPVRTVRAANPNGYRSPIEGEYYITSSFGIRPSPFEKGTFQKHKGIDLGGENINGKIVHAIDDGRVAGSRFSEGGGHLVYLVHDNGDATQYLHMQKNSTPKQGTLVKAGDEIGRVGSSGESTGPHLHIDYFPGGSGKEDPFKLLEVTSDHVSGTPGKRGNNRTGLTAAQLDASGGSGAIETNARQMGTDIEEGGITESFREYKYLTPEEQIRGIVPFFDQTLARSHGLFKYLGGDDDVDAYMVQLLQSELLWQRFSQRTIPAMSMPFNPSPVAGFPSIIVDKIRSIIARITSITHNISVGGGAGNATTNVSFDSPRFWNEGDPYYWVDGKPEWNTIKGEGSFAGRRVPDPSKSSFPAYYNPALIGTNSTEEDFHGKEIKDLLSGTKNRPVDNFYRSILGPQVQGIPYQYDRRSSKMNNDVSINKAIDGNDPGRDYPRTLVGYYYRMVDINPALAHSFVEDFTRRDGVRENEIMSVLNASADAGNRGYSGGPFRAKNPDDATAPDEYQDLVKKINLALGARSIRG